MWRSPPVNATRNRSSQPRARRCAPQPANTCFIVLPIAAGDSVTVTPALLSSVPLFFQSPEPFAEPLVLPHHGAHLIEHVIELRVEPAEFLIVADHHRRQDANIVLDRGKIVDDAAELPCQELKRDVLVTHIGSLRAGQW